MTDAPMPLPCPFCGCKVADAGFWFAKTDTPPMAYVFCLECSETEATDGPKRETLEEAVTAWNRRASLTGCRRVDLGMVATTIETMHRRIEKLTGSRQSQYDGAVSLARDLYLSADT